MEIEDRKKVYEQLEEQKGQKHQILVVIEEMSELTKELTKYLREDSYTNSKKICEEMADAKVGLEQLDRFFDPEQKLVPFIMDYKLERLNMFYLKNKHDDNHDIIVYNDKRYRKNKLIATQKELLPEDEFQKWYDTFIIQKESSNDLVFGMMTYDKKSGAYEWHVTIKSKNEKITLIFHSVKEFIDNNKFNQECMRQTKFIPVEIEGKVWACIVNDTLADLKVIE
jgi:hypothetical protein